MTQLIEIASDMKDLLLGIFVLLIGILIQISLGIVLMKKK